jgi:hypothetical protein
MTTDHLAGGCLCGAVRYEIERVFDVMYCHCSRCRKTTGAPVVACAYASSAEGDRCFCGECGSALYFEGRGGRYYSVHVGTLDDPEQAPPRIHQCIETRLAWLELADDLPRVAGNRLPHPDKRPRRRD